MSKPSRTTIAKFMPWCKDFVDLTLYVVSTRTDMEKQALFAAPMEPLTAVNIISVAFRKLAEKHYMPMDARAAHEERQRELYGHDMRCALLLLMDRHRLTLPLSAAETADLDQCLAYEHQGRKIYADIRALGMQGFKPVQPVTQPGLENHP